MIKIKTNYVDSVNLVYLLLYLQSFKINWVMKVDKNTFFRHSILFLNISYSFFLFLRSTDIYQICSLRLFFIYFYFRIQIWTGLPDTPLGQTTLVIWALLPVLPESSDPHHTNHKISIFYATYQHWFYVVKWWYLIQMNVTKWNVHSQVIFSNGQFKLKSKVDFYIFFFH